MQSEYSKVSGFPCSAQQCDILCWLGQYFFMEVPANKQTFVRMHVFAYYNLRGLTLLYAQLLTSMADHLSPIQTTDPVCPTTPLSNAYLIPPISDFFGHKPPPPSPTENVLCTEDNGSQDSLSM